MKTVFWFLVKMVAEAISILINHHLKDTDYDGQGLLQGPKMGVKNTWNENTATGLVVPITEI